LAIGWPWGKGSTSGRAMANPTPDGGRRQSRTHFYHFYVAHPHWFPSFVQPKGSARFLVTEHDPQVDTQFVHPRNLRFARSFMDQLATIEAFQLRILPYGMYRSLLSTDRAAGELPSLLSFPNRCLFPLLCSPGIIPV
jgi:hypothetical protein